MYIIYYTNIRIVRTRSFRTKNTRGVHNIRIGKHNIIFTYVYAYALYTSCRRIIVMLLKRT